MMPKDDSGRGRRPARGGSIRASGRPGPNAPKDGASAAGGRGPQRDVQDIIESRESSHGNFRTQADVAQNLKAILRRSPNWDRLPLDMCESLEMQMVKVSRIVCGDFNHADSWEDLAGYATLVSNRL